MFFHVFMWIDAAGVFYFSLHCARFNGTYCIKKPISNDFEITANRLKDAVLLSKLTKFKIHLSIDSLNNNRKKNYVQLKCTCKLNLKLKTKTTNSKQTNEFTMFYMWIELNRIELRDKRTTVCTPVCKMFNNSHRNNLTKAN